MRKENWASWPKNPKLEASSLGKIRYAPTQDIIEPFLNTRNGYKYVAYNHRVFSVHRLVLESHRPNLFLWNYTLCDHIDRNPINNCLCNLRWSNDVLNGLNKNSKGWTLQKYGYYRTKKGTLRRCTRKKMYKAQLRVLGIDQKLGSYKTAEEAHTAYLNAKVDLMNLYDPCGEYTACEFGSGPPQLAPEPSETDGNDPLSDPPRDHEGQDG